MTNRRTARVAGLAAFTAMLVAGGVYAASDASAIQNGTSASVDTYPWTVALMLDGASPDKQECSGTLVSPTKVVTAAHCYDYEAGDTTHPYPPSPPKEPKRWTIVASCHPIGRCGAGTPNRRRPGGLVRGCVRRDRTLAMESPLARHQTPGSTSSVILICRESRCHADEREPFRRDRRSCERERGRG